jgi:AraC family transcriptional regulator of adaptative response / DNA-3-methyladenine glycosylase II
MSFDTQYAALASRDTRFDGQFIVGVTTTGIYCRPSCPAIMPKRSNVRFFRTAAAAHDAGLRACKRCQPDAVPGSPDWNLHDDLASRAMRLVQDGVVEREGVDGLARRLGYTPRHVSRVLQTELGAGPLALARANRAQTARSLLAAGYSFRAPRDHAAWVSTECDSGCGGRRGADAATSSPRTLRFVGTVPLLLGSRDRRPRAR